MGKFQPERLVLSRSQAMGHVQVVEPIWVKMGVLDEEALKAGKG